jgi:hypothetical protein
VKRDLSNTFYFNAEALTKRCCLGSLGKPDLCVVAPQDDSKTVTGKHKVILANLGGSLFLETTRYLSGNLFVSSVSVFAAAAKMFPSGTFGDRSQLSIVFVVLFLERMHARPWIRTHRVFPPGEGELSRSADQ